MALIRADGKGPITPDQAGNALKGRILTSAGQDNYLQGLAPNWTKTQLVRYDNPEKGLGKTLDVVDPQTGKKFVIAIPKEHQGKKSATLILELAGVTIETEGNTLVVKAVIEEFPRNPSAEPILVDKYGLRMKK